MSSSAINTQVAQLKIGNVQNQADNSAVYSGGIWSLKNSTALTSVTITDAGNVGIGTASPSTPLHLRKTTAADTYLRSQNSLADAYYGASGDGRVLTWTVSAQPLVFGTNDTERMRIDASGSLIMAAASGGTAKGRIVVGNTTTPSSNINGYVQIVASATDPYAIAIQGTTSTGQGYIGFFNSTGALQGSISKPNDTTTAFNTSSSDYRLKEQVQDLSGGLEKVKALRPVSFTWKNSGKTDFGFIAHELQAVIPECITGEKDAVDAEGGPVYQSIFPAPAQMIASLVAAIQELSAKNDALEARLAALEAK